MKHAKEWALLRNHLEKHGLKATKQPNEVEDFLYAFFVTCVHARDWLLATKSVRAPPLFRSNK